MSIAVKPPPMTTAGQLRLQVGEGLLLERAGQLERHQEVRRLPDPPDDVVLHGDDRGAAGAGRDRDVVEAQVERLLGRDGPAEAHAPEDFEAAPAGERQVDEGQEVLVPADRDSVLRDAPESGERPLVETARDRRVVPDRLDPEAVLAGPLRRKGFDLQAVDADDPEAFVDEVVRERVARGPQSHDEDTCARCPGARTGGPATADSSASGGRRSRLPTAGRARRSGRPSRSAGCSPGPASGRCTPSCSRCRCGGPCPGTSGCR